MDRFDKLTEVYERNHHTLEGYDDREFLGVSCETCEHSATEHSWINRHCLRREVCKCEKFEFDEFTRDIKEMREGMR